MSTEQSQITHRKLCLLAAEYMKRHGITEWEKPTYVVCELELSNSECPDVFGFGSAHTQLIEVKVSRADFIKDGLKSFRMKPENGIGQLRSYLCPAGLIKRNELPENWGLLYYHEEDAYPIGLVKKPVLQPSHSMQEMNLAASILRREGIKSQIFSYKQYKSK
jgi:hypothetical protein